MMRTPLVLLARTQTTTAYGTPSYTYTTGATLMGQITDCTAEERMNHQKMDQLVTHRITLQFYPGINHYDRFTASVSRGTNGDARTATFEIVNIVDFRMQGHTLVCTCREIQ